ncbi:hypothetical protein HDU81_010029, partial [Chytriomyces hyalinus]
MSLKSAVSLGKRRAKDAQLGTDLDLACNSCIPASSIMFHVLTSRLYINTDMTPTLIAMGFPCPSLPKTLYRNSMTQ